MYRVKIIFMIAILFLVSICSATTLVDNGKAVSTIVVSNSHSKSMKRAAKTLSNYLEKVSGAKIKIVDSKSKVETSTTIWLGWSKALLKNIPEAKKPKKQEQIYIISEGNNLAIYGYDVSIKGHEPNKGTLNAVNTFLQKDIGVRWLWPGKLGTYIPQHKTVKVKEQKYTYTPKLKERAFRMDYREHYFKSYSLKGYPKFRKHAKTLDKLNRQWLFHQRAGVHGHSASMRLSASVVFSYWYKRYYKKYPEYFALQPDGTRGTYPSKPKYKKIDPSSSAVVKQWIKNNVAKLKYPWVTSVAAAVSDGAYAGFDTSSKSKAMDPKPGSDVPMVVLQWKDKNGKTIRKKHVALTDRYFKFYNKLAKGLESKLPKDKKFNIGVLAYGALRTPPVETEINKHIVVWFVGPIPFGTDKSRNRDKQLWQQWSKKATKMVWRPNMYQHSYGMPGLFLDRAGEDFKFLADQGMIGIDIDSIPNYWSTQGLQYYLMAQLAWNPYLNVNQVVEDYIVHAFGKAVAPAMKKYFKTMNSRQSIFHKKTRDLSLRQAITVFPEIYTKDWFKKLTYELNKAKSAAKGSSNTTRKQLKRLEFIKTGLEFMKLQIASIKAMYALNHGIGGDLVSLARNAVKITKKRHELFLKQIDSFAVGYVWFFTQIGKRHHLQSYLGPPNKTYTKLAEANDKNFKMLPVEWQFRLDPDNKGVSDNWYKKDIGDKLKWRKIHVTQWWDSQLKKDDPDDPRDRQYLGAAWYRTKFDGSPLNGKQLWLHFGAVDESCSIYLNDKFMGKQVYDEDKEPNAWLKPRRFNITKAMRPGKNNLVVRVTNEAGKGGIYKPVSLRYMEPNLISNGDFKNKFNSWRKHKIDSKQIGFANGKFVDRNSLHLQIDSSINPKKVASIRSAVINSPLKPGNYAFKIRYRVKSKYLGKKTIVGRLIPFPVTGKVNTREYVWLKPPKNLKEDDNWNTMSGVLHVTKDRPFKSFYITVFFENPGTYWVDNISLRRIPGKDE